MRPKYGGVTLETVLTFTHPSVAWEGAWSESARPHQWRGVEKTSHGVPGFHPWDIGKAAYAQAVLWLPSYVTRYAHHGQKLLPVKSF
jgi:hypothetical protein